MDILNTYLKSSIGKKQIVATTGLLLVGFILGHLAGNFFIYLGPEAFNGYAKKLAGLRPGLYLVEVGLFVVFVILRDRRLGRFENGSVRCPYPDCMDHAVSHQIDREPFLMCRYENNDGNRVCLKETCPKLKGNKC